MSPSEKTKAARRIRNREGAQRSREQNLTKQVAALQRENTRLKAQVTTTTAELDKIKSEFEEYKAQRQQNVSPFSSSSYYLHSPNELPALQPNDPMLLNPQNNTQGNNNNSITNPSTPTTNTQAAQGLDLPRLATTAAPATGTGTATGNPAPLAIGVGPDEPDLVHSVMQWKYPGAGYYDPSMYYQPHHQGQEIEEPALVFTPFAAVTSPREEVLLSPGAVAAAGGGAVGGGALGGVNNGVGGGGRVTEFSAWRPRDISGSNGNHHLNNLNNSGTTNEPSAPWWWASPGVGEQQHYYPRENSNTARELARMMSSPAAFSGPVGGINF